MSTACPASTRRAWRAVRAGVAASLTVCVALLGHLAGGGAAPSGAALATIAAGAAVLAHRLSGRRWDRRTLTALVVGVQSGVHLWCSIAAPASTVGADPAAAAVPGSAMLLGHALATVATIALLRHGERALWGLTELLVARPARRIAYAQHALPGCVTRDLALVGTDAPGGRLHDLLLAATLRRRGPPVWA